MPAKPHQVHGISRPTRKPVHCTANILPCRAHHDGSVTASKRYWNPHNTGDGALIAHFRGRRLKGKTLRVPAGYKGVVVKPSSKAVRDTSLQAEAVAEFERTSASVEPDARREDEEALQIAIRQGEYETGELRVMEQVAEIDDFVIWGHDEVPDRSEDSFTKGVEEWIATATAIHATDRK